MLCARELLPRGFPRKEASRWRGPGTRGPCCEEARLPGRGGKRASRSDEAAGEIGAPARRGQ